MRYAVVIENAGNNYSAYVPDLPGCIATAATVAEVEAEIREAIRFHIEGLRQDGMPVPEPASLAEYVELGRSPMAKTPKPERNSGKPWTAENVGELKSLVRENTPTRVIGLKLGRTPDAVYAKAQAEGISLKPVNQAPDKGRKSR